MIIDWLNVGKDRKIASEIILPVPPTPTVKGYIGNRSHINSSMAELSSNQRILCPCLP
jgi:hypothetical protein